MDLSFYAEENKEIIVNSNCWEIIYCCYTADCQGSLWSTHTSFPLLLPSRLNSQLENLHPKTQEAKIIHFYSLKKNKTR